MMFKLRFFLQAFHTSYFSRSPLHTRLHVMFNTIKAISWLKNWFVILNLGRVQLLMAVVWWPWRLRALAAGNFWGLGAFEAEDTFGIVINF